MFTYVYMLHRWQAADQVINSLRRPLSVVFLQAKPSMDRPVLLRRTDVAAVNRCRPLCQYLQKGKCTWGKKCHARHDLYDARLPSSSFRYVDGVVDMTLRPEFASAWTKFFDAKGCKRQIKPLHRSVQYWVARWLFMCIWIYTCMYLYNYISIYNNEWMA